MLSPIPSSHAQVPFPSPCKLASTYSPFHFAHALFQLDSLPTFTSVGGHMKVVWFDYISQWKRGKKVGLGWRERELKKKRLEIKGEEKRVSLVFVFGWSGWGYQKAKKKV